MIKNFRHEFTDELCSSGKATCVDSNEPSMGKFLAAGMEKCTGDILVFLEDDDIWADSKLEAVESHFRKNEKLGYFHNAVIPISEDEENSFRTREYESPDWAGTDQYLIKEPMSEKAGVLKLGRYFPDFNLSSIAVKKAILNKNMGWLENAVTAVDTFIFLMALESNNSILLSREQLTKYRRHSLNQSGKAGNDARSSLESLYAFTSKALLAYKIIEDWSEKTGKSQIRKIAARRVAFTRVLNSIQSPEVNRLGTARKGLKLVKYAGTFHPRLNLQAILLSIVYLISPGYARNKLAENMQGR